ncbi:MAG: hypothetical protein Q9219_004934 [cf. Caloplaca sp. 3 TL-2023]
MSDQTPGLEDPSTRKRICFSLCISTAPLTIHYNVSAGNKPVEEPDKAVNEQEDALIRKGEEISLSGLSLDHFTLPSRPSYGTQGRKIVLRTNYFRTQFRKGQQIFTHRLEITPKLKDDRTGRTNRRKTRRLIELLLARDTRLKSSAVATDYDQLLFTAEQLLPPGVGSRVVEQVYQELGDDRPGQKYQIKISHENTMAIQDLLDYLSQAPGTTHPSFDKAAILHALNVIVTRTANERPQIYGGGKRNKFYPYPSDQNNAYRLGSGLIALKGSYTSVRTSTLRVLVNINVANAAFYQAINLLELMKAHTPNKADYSRLGLESFISKLKVSHTYIKGNKKVKTVLGFSHPRLGQDLPSLGDAHQIKFDCPEIQKSGKISVSQYFQKSKFGYLKLTLELIRYVEYNIRLNEPGQPCINVGTREKPSWIPPELLTVEPGQQHLRKLNDQQTKLMIGFAVQKPADNAQQIMGQGAAMMGLSDNNPNLTYPTKNGSWNIQGRVFSEGRQLSNWSIVQFGHAEVSRQGVEEFKSKIRASGMNCLDPATPIMERLTGVETTDDGKIRKIMERAARGNLKILLVILPVKSQYVYSRVKFWAETEYGIHTVCSVGDFNSKKPEYWANVAHKFNLKLGGINQMLPSNKLGVLAEKIMLVGMDVTHPSPGSIEGAPSIAGVVASVDGRYGQWPASIRAQTSRKEMIEQLDELFGERLDSWQKRNRGDLPSRIFIYRDGVSEGQYRTLLEDELPQVQKACKARYPGGKIPRISIIVCGKRHHTRFYPTKAQDADFNGNPQNGTVVDRGITMEKGWDFFLQAHASPKGTAKPTHYVIIYDKNDMDANKMEAMVSFPIHQSLANKRWLTKRFLSVSRRTTSAISSLEQRRLFRFVLLLIMQICFANGDGPIFILLTIIGTINQRPLLDLAPGSIGIERHGSEESIPHFKIQCFTSE